MQKKGIEFVPATIIVLFLLIVTAFIVMGLSGKIFKDSSGTITCEAQGGTCQTTTCEGNPRLPFGCPDSTPICCSKG